MTELVGPQAPAAVGIAGLEAVHTWDGVLALNDRLNGFPRYKLHQIGGLYSKAEFEDRRQPAVGRIGEIPLLSFLRGKTLTYEGTMEAQTLDDLRALQGSLGGAFAPVDEREMVVTVDPRIGSAVYSYWARCISLDGTEAQEATPNRMTRGFERPFAIGLRMSDPRFYDVNEVATPLEPNDSATIDNEGNAPTDPVLQLTGPFTTAGVANNAVGSLLRFNAVAAGHFLTVDFASRQILLDGETDARAVLRLDIDADWWDSGVAGLLPGENVVSFIDVTGASDATGAIVQHHAAFWA
jgi:hypothetical protein